MEGQPEILTADSSFQLSKSTIFMYIYLQFNIILDAVKNNLFLTGICLEYIFWYKTILYVSYSHGLKLFAIL